MAANTVTYRTMKIPQQDHLESDLMRSGDTSLVCETSFKER